MDVPFILLHVSTLLTIIMLFLVLRLRNKKALHYYTLFADLDIFLWCSLALIQQYSQSTDVRFEQFLNNALNTAIVFLSVLLFFIGYTYSKSGLKINKNLNLLFIIPCIASILIWTNEFHHIIYINFSEFNSERIRGPVADAINYLNIVFIFLGLFYLIKSSIKNSGFFSKQSILMIVGAVFPVAAEVVYLTNIYSFPKYYDAIAFAITVICFLIAIFRFELFNIIPVALQTIVDHISDSYIVLNDQLEVTDYNKSFTDVFSNVTSLKRKIPLSALFSKQLSVRSSEMINELLEKVTEKKSCNFEIHIAEKEFDRYFIVEITPVFATSSIICTIILFKDVTEEKKDAEVIAQTQIMLIESEHMASLGQLVGGIAHNLKTPIMSIAGGLEGMSDLIDEYDESVGDSTVNDDDHHEIAKEMRVWIGKMKDYTAYMSDIITTVKGQAVQLTATTTDSFTLKELIKRVDILMNHELKRYSCKLKVCSDIDERTEIKGAVNSFVQVINNLIINAIEAYEGGEGVIEFIISRDDQMVLFEIKDHGSGMTEGVKSKLFKEMITTKAKSGTGLGLYMSYSTISGRFGGKMWFESILGMGTSFYIMIPAV